MPYPSLQHFPSFLTINW